jgi:hypothetical protein
MDDNALGSRLAASDPAIGLRAVAALRRLSDRMEVIQVANARQLGWSWAAIAAELGVTRQAVQQKHGKD